MNLRRLVLAWWLLVIASSSSSACDGAGTSRASTSGVTDGGAGAGDGAATDGAVLPAVAPGRLDPAFGANGTVVDDFLGSYRDISSVFFPSATSSSGWMLAWMGANDAGPGAHRARRIGPSGELGTPQSLEIGGESVGAFHSLVIAGSGPDLISSQCQTESDTFSLKPAKSVGSFGSDRPHALGVDGEGRGYVVMSLHSVGPQGFQILRIRADGTRDASYGRGGVTTVPIDQAAVVTAAVHASGRISFLSSGGLRDIDPMGVVAGAPRATLAGLDLQHDGVVGSAFDQSDRVWIAAAHATGTGGADEKTQRQLEFYRVDGASATKLAARLDAGRTWTNFSYSTLWDTQMLADGDGMTVAFGNDASRVTIARLDASGALDSRFGNSGITEVTAPGPTVAKSLLAWPERRFTLFGACRNCTDAGAFFVRVGR